MSATPYFSVPRDLFPKGAHLKKGHPDYGNPYSEREALVDLLSLANHDVRDGLPAGACDPAITVLERRWHWNRSRVCRALARWEKEGRIARENWPGRRSAVTRILGVGEAKLALLETIPPATHNKSVNTRLPGAAVTHPPIPIECSTVRESVDRPCPSCKNVAINPGRVECKRCAALADQADEIAAFAPSVVP